MNEHNGRAAVLAELRDEIAEFVLRVTLVVAGIFVAVGIWRALSTGNVSVHAWISATYVVILGCYLMRGRLPARIQLIVYLATGYAVGISLFAVFGVFGNGAAYLIATCAVAATLFGRTAGWTLVTVCTLSLLAPFAARLNGWEVATFDPEVFFASSRSWIAAIIVYAGIAMILILLAGRMTSQLLAHERDESALAARLATELAERESTERALRAEEARYAAAFASTPDALAVWDRPSGRLVQANQALAALAGVQADLLAGRPTHELWERLGAPRELATLAALADHDPVADYPVALPRATAGVREMLCNTATFESGGEQLAMLVMRDVSEQHADKRSLHRLTEELEGAVAERTSDLRSATAELETFAYSVAHHLRAPIRAMNSSASIFAEESGDALEAGQLARVNRVCALALDMGRQVDALLELSRINRRELRRENVDLSALATEAMAQLRAATPSREIEVRIEPRLHADADPALMRLVLANLLDNACKFSTRAAHSLVEFGCRRDDGGTAWFVRDNGVGFDMAYAAKLFEPFERLHAPSEFEGTGIGLATVARAVQRHGGRVWAESSPGRGATFWFRLG